MKLLELLVEKVKELPGVTYVLVGVTWIGAKMTAVDELAGIPLICAAVACALAYLLGSRLDKPLYDRLYGPQSSLSWLPKHASLSQARNAAAKALFGGEGFGVTSFLDAVKLGYVGEGRNLYDAAKTIVKASSEWDDRIARIHDISKAARSFLVIAFVALCAHALILLFPSAPGIPSLSRAFARAGWLGSPLSSVLALPFALGIYVWLRATHQIRLYEYLEKHLKLVRTSDDKFIPFLPNSWPGVLAPNPSLQSDEHRGRPTDSLGVRR